MKAEIAVNSARLYVEQMLTLHQDWKGQGVNILGDPTPVYEFVEMNGQEWRGTPWTKFRGRGYRKMTPRYCFFNSWYLSLVRPELTYYEGFAHAGLIPVHHAWCVDENGMVVDPTWRKSVQHDRPENEWEYFGVGFDSEKLCDWMREKQTASVLFDLNYNEDAKQFVVTA